MAHRRARRAQTRLLGALAALTIAGPAFAQDLRVGYAEPPDPYSRRPVPYPVDAPPATYVADAPAPRELDAPSPFRLSVGSAGRTSSDGLRAGLFAALDLGRGPAGFRLSGTWVRVGYDDPLAQYTGELTLTLGDRSRVVPTLGVGGGLAHTFRVDDSGHRTDGGSNLGVGVLRASLDYRLPLHETDARAGIGITATLPAVRGDGAPDLGPWLLIGASVGIGF